MSWQELDLIPGIRIRQATRCPLSSCPAFQGYHSRFGLFRFACSKCFLGIVSILSSWKVTSGHSPAILRLPLYHPCLRLRQLSSRTPADPWQWQPGSHAPSCAGQMQLAPRCPRARSGPCRDCRCETYIQCTCTPTQHSYRSVGKEASSQCRCCYSSCCLAEKQQ